MEVKHTIISERYHMISERNSSNGMGMNNGYGSLWLLKRVMQWTLQDNVEQGDLEGGGEMESARR